ncbi:YtxH domain-containing protein [Halobacillus yeomjeoni]|uniref:YtxH domain-containing protein n=1 Tax=Halobacillus yeomjeoni TaxID=311194 RepID=A0A931HXI3_9BACI|nr:YtxH domain-containing protein [Halobacillus yeomjeoni]MBH0231220.1 YtxH domain-containing protein [Halobacillus yeomjeoni]MCA0984134.1 YtxH domain-containing protein [Halobacillus yeomjeoni]
MGQQKLLKGVLLGAFVGGAMMLLDKDTREYVGEKSKNAGSACKGYMQHPHEAIHSLRVNYEYLSNRINNGIEDLLQLLDKAEQMLNKVGEINQEVEQKLKKAEDSKEAS